MKKLFPDTTIDGGTTIYFNLGPSPKHILDELKRETEEQKEKRKKKEKYAKRTF